MPLDTRYYCNSVQESDVCFCLQQVNTLCNPFFILLVFVAFKKRGFCI